MNKKTASTNNQSNNLRDQLTKNVLLIKQKASGKAYPREFYYNPYGNYITYVGSRKIFGGARIYHIRDINEVRSGHESHVFDSLVKRGTIRSQDANLSFSILYKDHRQEEHLIANNAKTRDLWVSGIKELIAKNAKSDQGQLLRDDEWISNLFHSADKDRSNSLTKQECHALLQKSFYVKLSDTVFEKLFKDADKSAEGLLSSVEFVEFFKGLTRRRELLDIMKAYTSRTGTAPAQSIDLDRNELIGFLAQNGKFLETPEQVQGVINEFELNPNLSGQGRMGVDGFRNLLLSEHFNIVDVANLDHVYQDMTRPLCDYYINTSHNTFLFGNQLAGTANPEAYTRALLMGVRVLDLDCYDGPTEDGPVVHNDSLLVKSCTFESIIRCLARHLFTASKYPVILYIENHCSPDQQKIMVQILKKHLGENLLTKPIPGKAPPNLPSPDDLKQRVLICSKAPSQQKEAADPKVAANKDEELFASLAKDVIPELSELLIYLPNVPYRDYDYSKANYTAVQSTTLDEKHLVKLTESDPIRLVQQTTWRIYRSYPDDDRENSSNQDPVLAWSFGIQMVAMNYQTDDDMLALYHGKFLDNGGCGYVLKPDYLKNACNVEFNPWNPPSNFYKNTTMRIRIISGQFLFQPNTENTETLDPYIKVATHGFRSDNKHYQTRIISNNGFNPNWNQTFTFDMKFPEMCLVHISVMDSNADRKDECIAFFAAPFGMIQKGFRHVHLRAIDNEKIHSTLFVYVEIEEHK